MTKLTATGKIKTSNISEADLRNALELCNWHQSETAKMLHSSPATINRLIKFYGIERVVRADIKLDIEFNIFGIPVINKMHFTDVYLADLIKRLEAAINVVGDITWLCDYSTINGYPKIGTYTNGKSVGYRVHRLIYFLTKEILTEDVCLLHKDDNPHNVHPDNLFTGTRAENNNDKAAKFRTGSDLSESDIHHIVELFETHGWSKAAIGAKFDKSTTQITRILTGDAFKHVERKLFVFPTRTNNVIGGISKNTDLTDEKVLEIRKKYTDGVTISELGREYKKDRKTISAIVKRVTWTHI